MDNIVNIIIPLLFSVFFSGMESAFLSANKLRYELDKKNKSLTSRILDFFFHNPESFISTMLVGNCIALVVYGLQIAVGLELWLSCFVEPVLLVILIVSLLATLLWLLVGEFLPQILFRINPNLSLKLFAVPLYIIYIVLYPVSKLSSLLSFVILRLAGVKNLNVTKVYTLGKMDLNDFIQQSIDEASDKSDMDTEVKMFQNALDFSKVRLRDCMIPRTEIVACDKTVSMDELRTRFIETGLSKILVYDENIDNIIGYIHSSELFNHPDDWTARIRKVPIVPEAMAANKLMRDLMQEKKSLAVVVDEFGGITGIVTLEDLVEEIFGEIEDEHDVKTRIAKKIADDEYLLSGRTEIDSLNEMFGLDLPESDDYITVAGFILHVYQKFPKLNESVIYGKYSFKIVKATATKIELVRMKVREE